MRSRANEWIIKQQRIDEIDEEVHRELVGLSIY